MKSKFKKLEQARSIVEQAETISFKAQGKSAQLTLPEDLREQFLAYLDYQIKQERFNSFFCQPKQNTDHEEKQKSPTGKSQRG